MNRDPLPDALRELPRHRASAYFTSRVMARLDEKPARSRWLVPAPAFLAAACVLLLTVAGVTRHAINEHRRERVRQELLAEQQQLERELMELKAMADSQPDVLYVGGTEEADVLIDLRASGTSARPSAVPASLNVNTTEKTGELTWQETY